MNPDTRSVIAYVPLSTVPKRFVRYKVIPPGGFALNQLLVASNYENACCSRCSPMLRALIVQTMQFVIAYNIPISTYSKRCYWRVSHYQAPSWTALRLTQG